VPERRRGDRRLRRIEIQNYVLYGVVIALVAIGVWQLTDRQDNTDATARVAATAARDAKAASRAVNRAVCTWRRDLQSNVRQSQRLLRENPDGIPGIPNALLRENIRNRKRTIRSFMNLNCRGSG